MLCIKKNYKYLKQVFVARKQVEREKRQLAKEAGMIRGEINGAEVGIGKK